MRTATCLLLGMVSVGGLAWMGSSELRMRRELAELRTTSRSGARATPDSADSAAAPPALEAEAFRMLMSRMAALPPASAAPPAHHAVEGPDAAGPAEPPLTQQEAQGNVLTAYGEEAKDPAWGREAMQKLDASIRQALPVGSRLVSIDCHTTMCLVEVRHTDAKEAQSWTQSGFRGWPGAVFLAGEREDNGAVVQTWVPIKENAVPPYAGP